MPRLLYVIPALLLACAVGFFVYWAEQIPRPGAPQPAPEQPPAPPEEAKAEEKPKLVVLVVFDQLRGDYMTRWAEHYGPDGFERIKKEGIWFSDCHVPFACTSTGPAHASLATGAPPSTHGIVENVWYDRKARELVYCCQPNRFYDLIPPVPKELGKPGRGAANGFSPERLLSPTVGDALAEATKGKGRVFSLSLKDRTAVLMGGKKPSGVYCFDVRDGKFHTGAFYNRDAEPPWVREFNNARHADKWFDEKWEKFRPDIDYARFSGPDDVEFEAPGVNGQGRTFPHPFKGGLTAPAAPYFAAVEASPAGNELLFALAKKCVTAERLGRGESPDLLMVSFSSTDIVGHIYGTDSQEVMDITLRADKLVGELLKFLDAEVGKDRYVVVLTADHGACPMPELASTKKQYPAAKRVPLVELGLGLLDALDAMYGKAPAPTPWIEAFDDNTWPWLYLNHKAIESRKLKVEDVAIVVRDWLAGRGFIETAFTRAELEDGKFPPDQPFKKAAVLAYRADRCGDVMVIPKPGVLVTSYKTGTSHGSPHPYDTHVPFLVYGAGVPALGQRKEKVSSLSITPTLAWALGTPAPKDAAVLMPEAIPPRR